MRTFLCLFTFSTPNKLLKFSLSRVNRFTIDHNGYLVNCESCNRSFLIAVFGLLTSYFISVRIAQRTQCVSTIRISWVDIINVECVWNVMAHAQKPDFVFRRNGRVHLNRQGRQFSRLVAAEVCASSVVMLDTPVSLSLPHPCVTMCHHISTGLYMCIHVNRLLFLLDFSPNIDKFLVIIQNMSLKENPYSGILKPTDPGHWTLEGTIPC
jgi:hypothetical protein